MKEFFVHPPVAPLLEFWLIEGRDESGKQHTIAMLPVIALPEATVKHLAESITQFLNDYETTRNRYRLRDDFTTH